MSKTLFEPFKIKVVENIPVSSPAERQSWIQAAYYNCFKLKSEQVMIDLLTDSGTTAMSDQQWAAMMTADVAYAGSSSFYDLEQEARELTGMEYIIPVHQGRAAEHLLFSTIIKPGEIVPSNGHFDTTLANIQDQKADGINLTIEQSTDPFLLHPFKGNMDTAKLRSFLEKNEMRVPCIMLTITNNVGGGQPVSLENMQEVAQIAKEFRKPFIIDACRFAENAYLIKKRESACSKLTVKEITKKIFCLADAITFSAKKDGLVNIGGLLCLRDSELADRLKQRLLLTEGFPTYGGLAGYSLAAMGQGLREVLDEKYLEYRIRSIEWMVEKLVNAKIPVVQPAGGHAVYIESATFFPKISRKDLPGIALTTELYIRGGIRACELGTVAFGKRDDKGQLTHPPLELVRLAIPRRVYTEAHMGYVIEILSEIYHDREKIGGYFFLDEPKVLRHFTAKFQKN